MVTWGYYAVTGIVLGEHASEQTKGSEAAEMVTTALAGRMDTTQAAFFACWWTEDPRRNPDALPDDMGVITGPRAHDDAIDEADRVIRRGKGRSVYAMSIGADYARRAFRTGVRRRESTAVVSRAVGHAALVDLGVAPEKATPALVRKAFKKLVRAAHPDGGGSAEAFQVLVATRDAAIAHARILEAERRSSAYARGEKPEEKPRRKRKAKAAQAEAKPEEVEHV